MRLIAENDLGLIVYKDKRYLKRLSSNMNFHGRGGQLPFSGLLGRPFGIKVGEYEIYEPTIEDIVMYGIKRQTQIIYPKDAAYICLKLGIRPGAKVLEIGTGSGVMTLIFSTLLGETGLIISLEREERHYKNAKGNIERFAIFKNTIIHHGDIMEYQDEEFDAVFIDVREPWLYLRRAWALLKGSGPIGMIVPTANQIVEILKEIPNGFGLVEVIEVMLRRYKLIPERVRPVDRMVAHTGYLCFARKLIGQSIPSPSTPPDEPPDRAL